MNIAKRFEQFSDIEIIQKILGGETALFEILIRRNNPYLYKVGMSYGYHHQDVQDLMQDTFINAYMNLSQFENRSSFKTWIIRIMLNRCYQKAQKSSFRYEKPVEHSIHENTPPMFANHHHTDTSKTVANRELNHVIENAIAQIPLDYRMVFSLREINGLNVAETAEALQITVANVKTRLNRAKNLLRKEIEKMYSADDIFEFNLVYCDSMVDRVMKQIGEL